MSMVLRRMMMGLVAVAISLSVAATSPLSKTADTAAVAHSYSMADFTRVRKYDAHVHANNPNTAFLEQARADGATIRTGGGFATGDQGSGGLDDGFFYLPTVIDDADRSMACVHDEAFGPTVTVETFTSEEEAVAVANDTEYGLAGAVWSSDAARARRVAGRLRHGTVWVNDFGPYLPQAEWGGFGHSGVGRELGPTGLDEYREAKHVYENLRPGVTGWFDDRGDHA